jgi:hypothetical protein
MSSTAMSLKGRINNYAKKHTIAAQVVLQNYIFERFWNVCLSLNIKKMVFLHVGGEYVLAEKRGRSSLGTNTIEKATIIWPYTLFGK